jgi:proteic killer suppression protein
LLSSVLFGLTASWVVCQYIFSLNLDAFKNDILVNSIFTLSVKMVLDNSIEVKYYICVDVDFEDSYLELLETDASFNSGFAQGVVEAFRKRMQMIRAAPDERVFYQFKSLRFEKLKGKRSHQHSMRLNDKYRLIVELRRGTSSKRLTVVSIEDYH